MQHRIKVGYRAAPGKPWKWELYNGERLVTASDDSFALQGEAFAAGKDALNQLRSAQTFS